MSPDAGSSPLRVEQALRLLPDIDALPPLRAFLISTSRMLPPTEPYSTVGKRYVQSGDLKDLVPRAVARVADHLAALYEAAVEALECERRGDLAEAVRALLRAGEREGQVGRRGQARVWYGQALLVAQELRERRPEIESLLRLAGLESSRGHYEEAARLYQRSLALADAERDHQNAALACRGLAEIALAQAKWQGAESWYNRARRYTEEDRLLAGDIHLGLAEVARHRGQLDVAEDQLRQARAIFGEMDDVEGMVRLLNAWGVFEALRQNHDEALASYSEALARLLRSGERWPALEITVRLHICQLYLDWNRIPDAEDELRRAEETAIVQGLTHELARVYVMMGKLRAWQKDDAGFVFFEKAVELCRERDPLPLLEAEVYLEYGLFHRALDSREEARGYLERAHEILKQVEDSRLLARTERELDAME